MASKLAASSFQVGSAQLYRPSSLRIAAASRTRSFFTKKLPTQTTLRITNLWPSHGQNQSTSMYRKTDRECRRYLLEQHETGLLMTPIFQATLLPTSPTVIACRWNSGCHRQGSDRLQFPPKNGAPIYLRHNSDATNGTGTQALIITA